MRRLDGDQGSGYRNFIISEAPASGWTTATYNSTWACTKNGAAASSGSGTSLTIDVAKGDIVLCTFTNTLKTGSLQAFKERSPDAPATNWDFAWTGPTNGSCSIVGDGSGAAATVEAGSYSLVETAGSATSLADYDTTWACTVNGLSGPSGSGTTISGLSVNANDAWICTFTNTHKVYADLTVSKTAAAAFTRTYVWDITKNVDASRANIADGASATFNYTVGVTHTSTDSAWAVSGKITVSNPNAFAVAGVDITDAIDNGGSCAVTGGTNVTVPANGSATVDYICTFASNPGAGTNTATATWNKDTYYTLTGSASGTKGV